MVLPLSMKSLNLSRRAELKQENSLLIFRFLIVWMLFSALAHYGLHFNYESMLPWGIPLILLWVFLNSILSILGKFQDWLVHEYAVVIICIVSIAGVVQVVPNKYYGLSLTSFANVQTIEYRHYPKNSKTLIVVISENGDIHAITNESYHEAYQSPAQLVPSKVITMDDVVADDREFDITPGLASGSIVRVGEEYFLVTNFHVLLGSRKELERLAILDIENDIGIINLKYVNLIGALPEDVSIYLSSLRNQKLHNRELYSVGLAQDHHYVVDSGHAYLFSDEWEDRENQFCFRVWQATDPKYNVSINGKSGSPVIDVLTGDQVGVLHGQRSRLGGFSDLNCHLFTGIDQIKANLSQLLRREQ